MSIVTGTNESVQKLLTYVGLGEVKYIREVHIHITPMDAVMLDVVIYANLPNSDEIETKHFNLVEVKEEQSIEEMKQNLLDVFLKPVVKKVEVGNKFNH